MRITRTARAFLLGFVALVAVVGLVAQPSSAFDPGAIFGSHFQDVPPDPGNSFRPERTPQQRASNPLMDTALFRFIHGLPLEPTSIGPEPKLPNDPEPTMGVVFVVSFY